MLFPSIDATTGVFFGWGGDGTGCVSANDPTGTSGCLPSSTSVFPRGATVDLVPFDLPFVPGTVGTDCTQVGSTQAGILPSGDALGHDREQRRGTGVPGLP